MSAMRREADFMGMSIRSFHAHCFADIPNDDDY